MKRQHAIHRHDSRRDARAQACAWNGATLTSGVGVVPMLGTFTAKINPRGVSGGLPREGNP